MKNLKSITHEKEARGWQTKNKIILAVQAQKRLEIQRMAKLFLIPTEHAIKLCDILAGQELPDDVETLLAFEHRTLLEGPKNHRQTPRTLEPFF